MSRVAQADVVVERAELGIPGRKAQTRIVLYDALARLGHVDSIDRYVADPPDGPFRDGTIEGPDDWDRYVIIRVIGHVTPFS